MKLLLSCTVVNRCQKIFSFIHLTIIKLPLRHTVDAVKIKNYVPMWPDFKIIYQEILVCIFTISRHLSNSDNLALNLHACNLETFKADFWQILQLCPQTEDFLPASLPF